MFAQMRAELGITKSEDILDHVYSRPTAAEQEEAMEKIRAIERTASMYNPFPSTLSPPPIHLSRISAPTQMVSTTLNALFSNMIPQCPLKCLSLASASS